MALRRALDNNKRGASRRDQAPAETKRTDRQNRNAERTKASPLNRLAIAFAYSLGGVMRLFVMSFIFRLF
ncbi:MAG: hypothetical protein HFE46_07425 [Clostridia bacterium]|nr:hypothetical protein [Clostridia bacterium]